MVTKFATVSAQRDGLGAVVVAQAAHLTCTSAHIGGSETQASARPVLKVAAAATGAGLLAAHATSATPAQRTWNVDKWARVETIPARPVLDPTGRSPRGSDVAAREGQAVSSSRREVVIA